MPPYFVTSREYSAALVELDDGRFQMLEQGKLAAFASGYRYLLVDRRLAKLLKSLKMPQVTFAPVAVVNRVTGEEHRTHVRVTVHESFDQDEIRSLQLEGPRLLTMNGEHFFVSPSLKQALEASGFSELQFFEGLSGFARAA
jgi:hypothetical protein